MSGGLGEALAAYYAGIVLVAILIAFAAGAGTFWLASLLISHLSISLGWS